MAEEMMYEESVLNAKNEALDSSAFCSFALSPDRNNWGWTYDFSNLNQIERIGFIKEAISLLESFIQTKDVDNED